MCVSEHSTFSSKVDLVIQIVIQTKKTYLKASYHYFLKNNWMMETKMFGQFLHIFPNKFADRERAK